MSLQSFYMSPIQFSDPKNASSPAIRAVDWILEEPCRGLFGARCSVPCVLAVHSILDVCQPIGWSTWLGKVACSTSFTLTAGIGWIGRARLSNHHGRINLGYLRRLHRVQPSTEPLYSRGQNWPEYPSFMNGANPIRRHQEPR